MAKAYRKKKSSTSGIRDTIEDLKHVLTPPQKLTSEERKVFDDLIAGREQSTWSDYDLNVACKLVKTGRQMDLLWDQYVDSGDDKAFAQWIKLVNPFQRMSNMLGLTASQRGLKKAPQDHRNKVERTVKRTLASVSPMLK